MRVLIGILNKIIAAVETRLFILLSLKKRSDCNSCCQLSMTGAAISIFFVATKGLFCLLSRQKYARHDKTIVATKLCLLPQNFLPRQHTSVGTKDVFCRDIQRVCRDKSKLVATTMILMAAPANDTQLHFC